MCLKLHNGGVGLIAGSGKHLRPTGNVRVSDNTVTGTNKLWLITIALTLQLFWFENTNYSAHLVFY
jgi:hypothetical protein